MNPPVYRLYPPPYEPVALRGLYLGLSLHTASSPGQALVYANFLSSLDGRIALENRNGDAYLPKTLTSPSDFRLFLELAAQADCLITHGGYLRALSAGKLGNILHIGQRDDCADLIPWRIEHGLNPQPVIVVASASLDFPMPDSIREHDQTCLIATGQKADTDKVEQWRARGYEVLLTGQGQRVEGGPLVTALVARGLRSLYLIAGPDMLDTMLRDGKLSRLFQTFNHQLMGGQAFRTLSPGPEYGPAGHLKLQSLYYEPISPNGTGQWFAQFDATHPSIPRIGT
jgi:riboflavin biosynthesis pyrimidine reductase